MKPDETGRSIRKANLLIMQIRLSLHQFQIRANVLCLLLHILPGDVGVNVHCGGIVCVPHDLLDNLMSLVLLQSLVQNVCRRCGH